MGSCILSKSTWLEPHVPVRLLQYSCAWSEGGTHTGLKLREIFIVFGSFSALASCSPLFCFHPSLYPVIPWSREFTSFSQHSYPPSITTHLFFLPAWSLLGPLANYQCPGGWLSKTTSTVKCFIGTSTFPSSFPLVQICSLVNPLLSTCRIQLSRVQGPLQPGPSLLLHIISNHILPIPPLWRSPLHFCVQWYYKGTVLKMHITGFCY